MCPKDHDFDWVKARRECVLPHEYRKLKDAVRQDIEGADDRAGKVQAREISTTDFWVYRTIYGSESGVSFLLSNDKYGNPGHIFITDHKKMEFTVTLVLNDEGECRYQIDGEGEYLRWQVVRRALESFMFLT